MGCASSKRNQQHSPVVSASGSVDRQRFGGSEKIRRRNSTNRKRRSRVSVAEEAGVVSAVAVGHEERQHREVAAVPSPLEKGAESDFIVVGPPVSGGSDDPVATTTTTATHNNPLECQFYLPGGFPGDSRIQSSSSSRCSLSHKSSSESDGGGARGKGGSHSLLATPQPQPTSEEDDQTNSLLHECDDDFLVRAEVTRVSLRGSKGGGGIFVLSAGRSPSHGSSFATPRGSLSFCCTPVNAAEFSGVPTTPSTDCREATPPNSYFLCPEPPTPLWWRDTNFQQTLLFGSDQEQPPRILSPPPTSSQRILPFPFPPPPSSPPEHLVQGDRPPSVRSPSVVMASTPLTLESSFTPSSALKRCVKDWVATTTSPPQAIPQQQEEDQGDMKGRTKATAAAAVAVADTSLAESWDVVMLEHPSSRTVPRGSFAHSSPIRIEGRKGRNKKKADLYK